MEEEELPVEGEDVSRSQGCDDLQGAAPGQEGGEGLAHEGEVLGARHGHPAAWRLMRLARGVAGFGGSL